MIINNDTDFLEGQVLVFDKPLYWTSFDLVKKVKNLIRNSYKYKKLKVGHAGTLDPLATGLMIICTGRATKTISNFQGMDKEYIATFCLGKTTPSFDLETKVNSIKPLDGIDEELVKDSLKSFLGEQQQIPPMFSAKNIGGKRAYEYARKGIEKVLPAKTVIFHELELLGYDLPYIKMKINCSKGTYVRALARDLGLKLGCGAYLSELVRTSVGEFKLEDAMKLEEFKNKLDSM
jgi:tRNA pseudouridine55 synthase